MYLCTLLENSQLYNFFLVSLLITVSSTSDYFLRQEYSLVKPYNGLGISWDILGNTMMTNKFVRVTSDEKSQTGHLWSKQPCYLKDWELHLNFRVHGHDRGDLHGDGFALWYVRDIMKMGPIFGSKDYFEGLGIFFDTYSNHNGPHEHDHPYISAMVNNGSLHYDHDRDGTLTQLDGCSRRFRNLPNSRSAFVTIRYVSDRLTVSTDLGEDTWINCFSVEGVHLPTGLYFGVSAATGDLSDNHDVISIRVYEIGQNSYDSKGEKYGNIIPSADNAEAMRDRHESDSSYSYFSILQIKVPKLLVIILVICLTVGMTFFGVFMWWQNRQRYESKRFY